MRQGFKVSWGLESALSRNDPASKTKKLRRVDIMQNNRKRNFYGFKNLTTILIACYVIGYILEFTNVGLIGYLTLDPYQILHGQVWRVVTWLMVPPSSFDVFTLIMLYCYWRIGTLLETIWGSRKYTRYIMGGVGLTVLSSFLMLAYMKFIVGLSGGYLELYSAVGSMLFSTYYINISIFMGYAATFPDMMVLYFFIIPLKAKILGYIDFIMLVFYFVMGSVYERFAIGAAILNIVIFLLTNRVAIDPKQIIRRQMRQAEIKKATKMQTKAAARHKCAICGQTEESNPNLEFRYCSKCKGNYEYCQEHLFTHTHVQ